MWSISCKTLGGPQLDLGPVEAVEGPKKAMLEKIGLVLLFKIRVKSFADRSQIQSAEADYVGASAD